MKPVMLNRSIKGFLLSTQALDKWWAFLMEIWYIYSSFIVSWTVAVQLSNQQFVFSVVRISWKKFIFLSLISEDHTHVLYRFFTNRLKYIKAVFLDISWIMAYKSWKPKGHLWTKLKRNVLRLARNLTQFWEDPYWSASMDWCWLIGCLLHPVSWTHPKTQTLCETCRQWLLTCCSSAAWPQVITGLGPSTKENTCYLVHLASSCTVSIFSLYIF